MGNWHEGVGLTVVEKYTIVAVLIMSDHFKVRVKDDLDAVGINRANGRNVPSRPRDLRRRTGCGYPIGIPLRASQRYRLANF